MPQELVYTSAVQGLSAEARGFCTVAATTGTARSWIEKLESLSGYQHLFSPESAEAARNPVAHSHFCFVVGTREASVISRVGAAPSDYSGRSNHLAHHLVLSSDERVRGGPALVLADGPLRSTWTEPPRWLDGPAILPAAEDPPAIPVTWESLTGDAGWAGVLAEAARERAVTYVVYAPGTDVLRLFREALALLPPAERWGVTFSTYFMRLPPGTECLWRGVPAGSKVLAEVDAARAQVIDLTRPLPRPKSSECVAAAREGRLTASKRAPTRPTPVARAQQSPKPRSGNRSEPAEDKLELAEDPPMLKDSGKWEALPPEDVEETAPTAAGHVRLLIAAATITVAGLLLLPLLPRLLHGSGADSAHGPSLAAGPTDKNSERSLPAIDLSELRDKIKALGDKLEELKGENSRLKDEIALLRSASQTTELSAGTVTAAIVELRQAVNDLKAARTAPLLMTSTSPPTEAASVTEAADTMDRAPIDASNKRVAEILKSLSEGLREEEAHINGVQHPKNLAELKDKLLLAREKYAAKLDLRRVEKLSKDKDKGHKKRENPTDRDGTLVWSFPESWSIEISRELEIKAMHSDMEQNLTASELKRHNIWVPLSFPFGSTTRIELQAGK